VGSVPVDFRGDSVAAIYADLTFTAESGAEVPVNGTVELTR
jgi:hypothetical protein